MEAMEIEEKQAPLIEQYVKEASTLTDDSSLSNLIVDATSHPSLFAFSEILAVPNLLQLQGTEKSVYIDLLRLFAHGTWTDYKSNAADLPQLLPAQALKLKQLSVLTLAEANKVLPYDELLEALEVANVRELEDFLINECMYVGIVKGKLDQLRRCFEVQFAAGRDLRCGQLESMIQTVSNCSNVEFFIDQVLSALAGGNGEYLVDMLATSDNVLLMIQDKIKWAETMCEGDRNHRKEFKDRMEEVKKSLHSKGGKQHQQGGKQFRGHQDSIYCEFDGEMDYEDELSLSKRRRPPKYRP
ncbi:hypothetical protein EZV62_023721 [Acer yangbiense]|uniref:PCI domain-containing protein n=1 Tax=Acer yangbiense TaxID=1000413 RepID=A0A5C7H2U4_9ROSI|nr:hypothetical protein EZV62_023721 [Acer yangbiense]